MTSSTMELDNILRNFYERNYKNGHFFRSVSETLNEMDEKSLRKKCKTYILECLENDEEKTKIQRILKNKKIDEYCLHIENTVKECDDLRKINKNIKPPILGQYDVEGCFISEILKIKIHVVEKCNNRKIKHFLIHDGRLKEIKYTEIVSSTDKNMIHILKLDENSYEALFPINVPDRDFKTKNPDAIDWGRPYEQGISAHIAIQLTLNSTVENFHLYNNVNNLGVFDDIVVRIKYREHQHKEDELFFLQLKHKTKNNKSFTYIFENKNGEFFLKKYLESYEKICRLRELNQNNQRNGILSKLFNNIKNENIGFILFSNIPINGDLVQTDNYLITKQETAQSINPIRDIFNTKINNDPYKIECRDSFPETYKTFLSKCWVLFNQIDAQDVDKLLENDLAHNLHPDKIKVIMHCFAHWTKIKEQIHITKPDMINLLVEHCFPHCDMLTSLPAKERTNTIGKTKTQLNDLKNEILNKIQEHFGNHIKEKTLYDVIDLKSVKTKEIEEHYKQKEMFSSCIRNNDLFYLLWQKKKLSMLIQHTDYNTESIKFFMKAFQEYFEKMDIVQIHEED